jgi:hypothetical protein
MSMIGKRLFVLLVAVVLTFPAPMMVVAEILASPQAMPYAELLAWISKLRSIRFPSCTPFTLRS